MAIMDSHVILKQYFGYDSFKSGQEELINSILDGKDVLAVMPTGSGKSICYQVPAMLLSGITIVISPLISLMQDQVKALNEAGIHAGYINSSLTERQISKVFDLASEGMYKILYVAPERLETYDFTNFASKVDISMVTVDEAHCISQWGQDFRPSYLKIVDFIDRLDKRPVVSAFTATATEEVKTDIACVLKLREPNIVVTGYDRENLYFNVESVKRKDEYVTEYIKKHPDESGIIYCATRKSVDMLYEMLSAAGVSVSRYHAGMNSEDRKRNQNDFIYDITPVIVATNAFGMGIDKSNVRFVIHYNMPQSMENYYQEAGRLKREKLRKERRAAVEARIGYELFDILRQLRLTIAGEEGLPPYIIFSDKTLIDMSVKTPTDKDSILSVSGVGEAKYEKYGDRFIEAVTAFMEKYPGAVTAIRDESETSEEKYTPRKRTKTHKVPFYLNPEDAERFEYKDLYLISEIKEQLNSITSAENAKHIFGTDIFRLFNGMGYVEEKEVDGRTVQIRTEAGLSKGIETAEKISKIGNTYTVLLYPRSIQKEIVEHYAGKERV